MKLIERKEIFKNYKNILSLIKDFQKAFFDQEYDNINDGEFDAIKLETKKVHNNSFVLGFNHSEINTFPKELSNKLTALFEFLNVNQLILISHLKLDFFGNFFFGIIIF